MDKEKINETKSELKSKGIISEKGIEVTERSCIDALSSRGYGIKGETSLILAFYEALYLNNKENLIVYSTKNLKLDFQDILRFYEKSNPNAWANYLVYRDLRSRGYVVRGGFGDGIDFRVYERGLFGKNVASTLILSTQEGKPLSVEFLSKVIKQCQSQKKALVLAVMNRRGEIVYYSVSNLIFANEGKKNA